MESAEEVEEPDALYVRVCPSCAAKLTATPSTAGIFCLTCHAVTTIVSIPGYHMHSADIQDHTLYGNRCLICRPDGAAIEVLTRDEYLKSLSNSGGEHHEGE